MKLSRTFSIVDALRFGFTTAIDNIGFFIKLMLVILGLSLAILFLTVGVAVLPFISQALTTLQQQGIDLLYTPGGMEHLMGMLGLSSFIWPQVISGIVLKAWGSLLTLGMTRIALDYYDMHGSSIKQLFSIWPLIIRNFFATGIAALAIAAGLILLLVPGLIIMTMAVFIPFVIVDKDTGIVQTFRECRVLTTGSRMAILGTIFILALINSVAFFFTFGLGIVITAPASALTLAYIYRKLEALPVPIA
jgi:uncharacterized membrane protein